MQGWTNATRERLRTTRRTALLGLTVALAAPGGLTAQSVVAADTVAAHASPPRLSKIVPRAAVGSAVGFGLGILATIPALGDDCDGCGLMVASIAVGSSAGAALGAASAGAPSGQAIAGGVLGFVAGATAMWAFHRAQPNASSVPNMLVFSTVHALVTALVSVS